MKRIGSEGHTIEIPTYSGVLRWGGRAWVELYINIKNPPGLKYCTVFIVVLSPETNFPKRTGRREEGREEKRTIVCFV